MCNFTIEEPEAY